MATGGESHVADAFDAGRVVRRAFASISSHWFLFLALGLPLVVAPELGRNWLLIRFGASDAGGLLGFALLPLVQAATCLFQAVIALVIAKDQLGPSGAAQQPVSRQIARRAWAVVVNGFLHFLGVLAAIALLIVPGLILATNWSVSVQAVAIEGHGPVAALRRSAELTIGNRGILFGMGAAVWAVNMLVGLLAALTLGNGKPLLTVWDTPLFAFAISPIQTLVLQSVFAAGIASAFLELEMLKGGPCRTAVAAVFD